MVVARGRLKWARRSRRPGRRSKNGLDRLCSKAFFFRRKVLVFDAGVVKGEKRRRTKGRGGTWKCLDGGMPTEEGKESSNQRDPEFFSAVLHFRP